MENHQNSLASLLFVELFKAPNKLTKPLIYVSLRKEPTACLFSKSSLAWLQEFWNSSICLYEIKRKNLVILLASGHQAVGNGEPWNHQNGSFAIQMTSKQKSEAMHAVSFTGLKNITVESYEPHGIPNHWQLSYLFNRQSRLTTKETSSPCYCWIPLSKGQ